MEQRKTEAARILSTGMGPARRAQTVQLEDVVMKRTGSREMDIMIVGALW